MKKILLFILTLAVYGNLSAQLKFDENFSNPPFTVSGNLANQNSWNSGVGTGHVQVVYSATNSAGTLVYPGYTSGRSYITTDDVNGRDPVKPFIGTTVPLGTAGTFFISFVVQVTSSTTSTGEYVVALRTDGNDNVSRFYVRNASGSVQFGISGNGSGAESWSGNYSYNTTYLIMIRYDIVTGGTTNDDMYMWVNPVTTSEPLTASATVTRENTAESYDGNPTGGVDDMNEFYIQQTGGSTPVAKFDAFKVAYGTGQLSQGANASAAWLNLAPQGAPLPVKLGGIKAYEKQSGIQLDWTAYSEENLSNYEVERSADGKTFEAIGNVAARNSPVETKYGWYDASPLPGVNFYRLKSIDIDSKSAYSSIVRVSLDKDSRTITIYPNPVQNGYLSFQSADLSRGDYWIKITNAAGQQLYSSKFSHNGGAINQTIELPASIRAGMYSLQLESREARVMSKSFIVQ